MHFIMFIIFLRHFFFAVDVAIKWKQGFEFSRFAQFSGPLALWRNPQQQPPAARSLRLARELPAPPFHSKPSFSFLFFFLPPPVWRASSSICFSWLPLSCARAVKRPLPLMFASIRWIFDRRQRQRRRLKVAAGHKHSRIQMSRHKNLWKIYLDSIKKETWVPVWTNITVYL